MIKKISFEKILGRLLIELRMFMFRLAPYSPRSVCCILLAKTESDADRFMTQLAIDSLLCQTSVNVTVIVVESGIPHEYNGVTCVPYVNESFNYNEALKLGFYSKPDATYDFYAFLNNDIVAESNCFVEICRYNAVSASPQNPLLGVHSTFERTIVGYNTIEHVCGWCICMRSDFVIDNLEILLPNEIPYYCQDTWVAECLRYVGIPHYLLRNARLLHIGGVSEGKDCVTLNIEEQIADYETTRQAISHRLEQLVNRLKGRGLAGLLDSWIYFLHLKKQPIMSKTFE